MCKTTSILSVIILFVLLIAPMSASAVEGPQDLFSHGSGSIEILIFTDYFCPPCQTVEPYLDEALTKLQELDTKITFVDMPIHEMTPLYSRYFLYAANAASSFTDKLHVRRVLFDIAKTKTINSEEELIQELKANQIKLAPLDVNPIFAQWVELIRRFTVKSTPTCVVARPGQEILTYRGGRAISNGIERLLQELTGAPKT